MVKFFQRRKIFLVYIFSLNSSSSNKINKTSFIYLVYGWRTNEKENNDSCIIFSFILLTLINGLSIDSLRWRNMMNLLLKAKCKYGSFVSLEYRFLSFSLNLGEVIIKICFVVDEAAFENIIQWKVANCIACLIIIRK